MVVGAIPELEVMPSIRKQVKQATMSKPISSIPPWSLCLLPPPGFCLAWVPALADFCQWTITWKLHRNKPFPPRHAFGLGIFVTATVTLTKTEGKVCFSHSLNGSWCGMCGGGTLRKVVTLHSRSGSKDECWHSVCSLLSLSLSGQEPRLMARCHPHSGLVFYALLILSGNALINMARSVFPWWFWITPSW